MSYFVSHVTPLRRARLHVASCDVLDRARSSHASQSGTSIEFDFLEQAQAYMDLQFAHFHDRSRCECCAPKAALRA